MRQETDVRWTLDTLVLEKSKVDVMSEGVDQPGDWVSRQKPRLRVRE